MQDEQNRKYQIAQVILAVWDSRKEKYIENVSDSYVAMTYGFVVDEVKEVREEFFGAARDKARALKEARSGLAKQLTLTRSIHPDLIRVWVATDQLSRLSPRLASALASLLIEIEHFHDTAASGGAPDHRKNSAALARFARYAVQHRDQIQVFQAAMEKLGQIVTLAGIETDLKPGERAVQEFARIEVREKLPFMAKSASRSFEEDPDIEDPYSWERD